MPTQNPNNDLQGVLQANASFAQSHPTAINAGNLAYKVSITSLAISTATAPINLLRTNMQVNKRPGPLVFAKTMARAFPSHLLAGQQRGAICVTSKHVSNKEEIQLESENLFTITPRTTGRPRFTHPLFSTLAFSQADTILPAICHNRAKLMSANIEAKQAQLTPYNLRKLLFMGYAIKSASNMFSFASLLMLSNKVSSVIPCKDITTANFTGGALAGGLCAVINHPLNEAHERLLLETTLDNKGRLSTPSSISFFKRHAQYAKNTGLLKAAKEFWVTTRGQFPLRALHSVLIFSLIQGFHQKLGDKPLSDLLGIESNESACNP